MKIIIRSNGRLCILFRFVSFFVFFTPSEEKWPLPTLYSSSSLKYCMRSFGFDMFCLSEISFLFWNSLGERLMAPSCE